MVKDFPYMHLFYHNNFIIIMYTCNLINRILKKTIEIKHLHRSFLTKDQIVDHHKKELFYLIRKSVMPLNKNQILTSGHYLLIKYITLFHDTHLF